jgi:pyruvate-formate lyase-activating enzyme
MDMDELTQLNEELAAALAAVKLDLDEAKLDLKASQREVSNLKTEVSVLRMKNNVLELGLRKYADKNFWIRVPPYTLAQADKGAIAAQALREAYTPENNDNA